MTDDEHLRMKKFLDQSFVFKGLDDPIKRELVSFAHMKQFAAGEIIFNAGAAGVSMMAIVAGFVRVSMLTPTAREVTLRELGPGEVFGEIAMLDGGPRSATVRAVTNCTLVVLERRSLLYVMQNSPGVSIRLIEMLCGMIRRSDERMIEIAFLDLPSRIARLLLRLTAAEPSSGGGPLTRLSISQADIANMIGSSRENVNRCLRKWQRMELIDLNGGRLVLLDRAGLEVIAFNGY